MTTFDTLGLSAPILDAVKAGGYEQPTPIQERAIPAILFGKDLLGIAPTGSGKTLAYALPALQLLLEGKWELSNRHVPILFVVPTRELAGQVEEVLQTLVATLTNKIKVAAVFGGVSINPQMIGMQGVDILIATPGRLLDLMDHKAVHLGSVKYLVLDEADKMLDLGFREEMDRVLAALPKKRQNLLFSATLNAAVDAITQLVLHKPEVIQLTEEPQEVTLIQQRAFRVDQEKKGPFLRYLIRSMDMQQVLIFTASGHSADHVADKLKKHGIDAESTHGKKSQGARQNALAAFKKGTLRVLVATDLLSRGIDIDSLPYVINYELPRSPKDYIHRIGRTGRAAQAGEAISIITPEDQHHFKVIQKKMKQWVTLEGTEDIDLSGV
ncbi:MAG: DEAD/DEAH box helicase [Flavobacteriales bacterium]|nr:DEAD/DEAH box helicase [Flavobacteriales bacterium]HQV53679.1 DEAD/DEAH box helicase [Flavobacteriales bacterium]HQX30528.1 DEAD/DEAH box helicase [Flavobacteriales bacterium]HQX39571.1 DEAD/DEAH box helicase [Flavobacteriales bacterium]HQZ93790.1 DEAD/DEAH box helicase [Flavobacteriales bacterium]